MSPFVPTAAAVLLTLVPLIADQVTLKNGDRISGRIVKSDATTLTIKSEFAGDIAIQWPAITTISSSEPLYFTTAGGQVLVGTVETVDGKLKIVTKDAGEVVTAKEQIKAIRSKGEEESYQAALERLRNPGVLDLWSGYIDTGLSMTSGNAQTSTYSMGFVAARTSQRDKVSTYFNALHARNKTTGVALTTADAVRGGIRYDLNVSDRSYGFGFTDLEFDRFQKLDLRAVFGGGVGRHMVKTDTTTFDLFGGGSLNKEFFTTLTRSTGELLAGDEFSFKLVKSTQIKQRFTIFPNLEQRGEFRATLDLAAVTALNKWLGWQITLSDRYLSNPIPGVKKNDVLLTTGIRLTFAR